MCIIATDGAFVLVGLLLCFFFFSLSLCSLYHYVSTCTAVLLADTAALWPRGCTLSRWACVLFCPPPSPFFCGCVQCIPLSVSLSRSIGLSSKLYMPWALCAQIACGKPGLCLGKCLQLSCCSRVLWKTVRWFCQAGLPSRLQFPSL